MVNLTSKSSKYIMSDAKVIVDYSCARCEKRLPTKNHLREHFRVNHERWEFFNIGTPCSYNQVAYSYGGTNVEIHRCEHIDCGKSFSSFTPFKNHWIIHEPQQLICTKCPAKFRHRQSLRTHLLKRHNKVGRKIRCCLWIKKPVRRWICRETQIVWMRTVWKSLPNWLSAELPRGLSQISAVQLYRLWEKIFSIDRFAVPRKTRSQEKVHTMEVVYIHRLI